MPNIKKIEKQGYPVGLQPCDPAQMRFVAGEDVFGEDEKDRIYLMFCTDKEFWELTSFTTDEELQDILKVHKDKLLKGSLWLDINDPPPMNHMNEEQDRGLERLRRVCQNAVNYVGSANYPEREGIAHSNIANAFALYRSEKYDKIEFDDCIDVSKNYM